MSVPLRLRQSCCCSSASTEGQGLIAIYLILQPSYGLRRYEHMIRRGILCLAAISLVLFGSCAEEGVAAIEGSNVGCTQDAVCDGEPFIGMTGVYCMYGRLSHSRPAFAISLNQVIREETQHFPGFFQSAFEEECNLYNPLPVAVKKRLNVTGWEEIAIMIAVEEPMDRLVTAWNDMSLQAVEMANDSERLKGFEWLIEMVHDMPKIRNGQVEVAEALKVLRTPEVYHRFLTTYLHHIQQPHALHWAYDDHLMPQTFNIGVCSKQLFRNRVLVRPERIASDTYNFLVLHAEASMQQDAPLLKHLSSLPRMRSSVSSSLLDTGSLLHEASFSLLWDQIRHTEYIQTELRCTGYATDDDMAAPAAIAGTPFPAIPAHKDQSKKKHAAVDEKMMSVLPPNPGTLPATCETSACEVNSMKFTLKTRCVFARLAGNRPAFALSLNPKCAGSVVRDILKRHEHLFESLVEAPCSLYSELSSEIRTILNVTSWREIALLIPVRDPMERFVSAWHEITLASAMGLEGHDGGALVFGFEWMLDMLIEVSELDGRPPSQSDALKMLRTPDVFRTFLYRYLEYALPSNVREWKYAPSLLPQLQHMGICSEQAFRTRFIVPIEHLHTGLRYFLMEYSGARHDSDKTLLESISHFPRPQKASETEFLDANAITSERSEFAALWTRVQHSHLMSLDYACTGYSLSSALG